MSRFSQRTTKRLISCSTWYLLLLLIHCTPPVKDFFTDDYFVQDHIYRNQALGFSLTYTPNWRLATTPRTMTRTGQQVARQLHESGAELLYQGQTLEGNHGTRAIAEHLNLSDEDYQKAVAKANRSSIQADYGTTMFSTPETIVLKWEYTYADFKFVEYFFKCATYNVRVAFWTSPQLYAQFLPVYDEIMTSLTSLQ